VSSRAAGVTESNGHVKLKRLFTYDLVADPGFSSAKMGNINESFGLKTDSNIQIYDLTSQNKTNKLFNMNNNNMVTKKMLNEYSQYINGELENIQTQLKDAVSGKSKLDKSEIKKLAEGFDNLKENQSKMIEYLDYVAENIAIIRKENKSLKNTQQKLISHNNHISENVNSVIDYSNYLGSKVEKNINYTKQIAENVNKTIRYADYISENVEKTILYSNHLAENLDNAIKYSNYLGQKVEEGISYASYIAENLDNNIKYSNYLGQKVEENIKFSNYIAENLDTAIQHNDYLAENLDNSIKYSEYLAENVDNNIKYSEYLAENVNNNIQYGEYIAENLNNTLKYTNYLAESIEHSINYTESVVDHINEAYGHDTKKLRKADQIFETYLNKGNYKVNENMTDVDIEDFDAPEAPTYSGFIPSPEQEIEIENGAYKVGEIVDTPMGQGEIEEIMEMTAQVKLLEGNKIVPVSLAFLTRPQNINEEIKQLVEKAKSEKPAEIDFKPILENFSMDQKLSFYSLLESQREYVVSKINESDYVNPMMINTIIAEARTINKTENVFENLAIKKMF
jgi:methyl-accepting chemotaxis protein